MPYKDPEARRAYDRRRNATPERRAYNASRNPGYVARYRGTLKGVLTNALNHIRYNAEHRGGS